MSTPPTPEALQAARRTVARIRSYGIDGPRPIEEIEALLEYDDQVDAALRAALESAGADELAAAIHLVVLLRRDAVIDAVRRRAFEEPGSFEVKREALEALRACGIEPDAVVVARFAIIERIVSSAEAGPLDELLDWPEAWQRPALQAWLGVAGPAQLDTVEASLGRDDELDGKLLDWVAALASAEAAEVLQRYLVAAHDRNRVKQAKRALHRMRSKGFDVGELDDGSAPGPGFSMRLENASLEGSRAYATSIDGGGARLLWVLWRSPSGGSRLLQAVIDDSRGLREAEMATVTRKGFRDYVEQMRSNPAVLMDQMDVAEALERLAGAARRSESAGHDVPAAYRDWAAQVGSPALAVDEPSRPRIYNVIDAEAVSGDAALIEESMNLLRDAHFQSWAMDGATIESAAEEIHQAETSTLMISEEQRRERMQEAIQDAVRESFDDDARGLYRNRLEEMATMLWGRGDEDAARQALAAAVGLTEIEDLFRGHAFARALVHRGVWLAYQERQREMQAEQQRSGLITP